jgi:hypothetical protein
VPSDTDSPDEEIIKKKDKDTKKTKKSKEDKDTKKSKEDKDTKKSKEDKDTKKTKKSNEIDAKKEIITKEQIISLFKENIKGNEHTKNNDDHDGEEGQWLEKLMNLKPNSKNAPDIGGYEMKKDSKKISFGDWSAEYLFSPKRDLIYDINDEEINLTKEQFIKHFGNKNEDRYSWSGSCVPKYGKWNDCGQMLKIDENNNILAMYSYDKDKRKNKTTNKWKGKEICIAVWSCEKMKKHVDDKFNQKGFFVCKKNKDGKYDKICFGPPINYELFIEKVKSGDIFFDSGMYYDSNKPNTRLYSQWRASQKFWNNLLTEEYS